MTRTASRRVPSRLRMAFHPVAWPQPGGSRVVLFLPSDRASYVDAQALVLMAAGAPPDLEAAARRRDRSLSLWARRRGGGDLPSTARR